PSSTSTKLRSFTPGPTIQRYRHARAVPGRAGRSDGTRRNHGRGETRPRRVPGAPVARSRMVLIALTVGLVVINAAGVFGRLAEAHVIVAAASASAVDDPDARIVVQ